MARHDEFSELLAGFSVEDLREFARLRGLKVPSLPTAGRQQLMKAAAPALENPHFVELVMRRTNLAALAVLFRLIKSNGKLGRSGLERLAGPHSSQVLLRLEQLRVAGLVFPNGDWEHIVVTNGARRASSYLLPAATLDKELPGLMAAPEFSSVSASGLSGRPGLFARDLAEFLGRVGRGSYKITRSMTINRRDLNAVAPALVVDDEGYVDFVFSVVAKRRYLVLSEESEIICLGRATQEDLKLSLMDLTEVLLNTWLETPDPIGVDDRIWSPELGWIREWFWKLISAGKPLRLDEVSAACSWAFPLYARYQHEEAIFYILLGLTGVLRWFGLADIDSMDDPKRLGLSGFGKLLVEKAGPVPAWESTFILQANAEAILPPNLQPYVRMQMRRITGERKGAPEGVVCFTKESLSRALQNGITGEQITAFLTRHSKTGIPSTIEDMLRTAVRQHGRLRLVPTDFVLVTDTPELLAELRQLKTTAGHLGTGLTPTAVKVARKEVPGLLRQLKQRGYSPVDESEQYENLPLD